MDKTYLYYITLNLLTDDVIRKCERAMSVNFGLDTNNVMDYYNTHYGKENLKTMYVTFDSGGAVHMLNKEEFKDKEKKNSDMQFIKFKQEKSLINLF